MNPELLTRLLDAGFSHDEIMQLAGTPAAAAPAATDAPETTNETETQDQEPAAPAPAPAADAETSEIENRLTGIESSIKDMMKQFQQENLKRDSFNNTPAESLESQTDKIMMSIIRPEKKGENSK